MRRQVVKRQTNEIAAVTPLFTLSSSRMRTLSASRRHCRRVAAMIEESQNRRHNFVHRQAEERNALVDIIITLVGFLTPNPEWLLWVREW